MRKIYIMTLLSAICISSYSQTVQATIKAGTQPNSIILSIKPSATLTNARLSTINFSVAVPAIALPRPSISIKTNYNSSIAYEIQSAPVTELITGNLYYIYNLLGDGNVLAGNEKTYTAGVDNDMLELAFTNGPLLTTYTLRAVNLPDGGLTSFANFYIANLGNDITNTSSMFYGLSPVNSLLGYAGLSYTNVENIVLPTKFISFFATKSDDNAKLTWTVDNEENNAYFEVEGSTDGRTFTTLQRVNALHNGRSSNTYATSDINIGRYNATILYYRIKQVEASNSVIYSEVRQVALTGKNFTAALYPNPVKTVTKLVIEAPEAGKATVVIRDVAGKTVKQISLQLVKGTNQQQLDATLFAAGDYNVTIASEKLNQTIKMTKSN